ncbi:hypothetical protein [Halococcus agarilyticus]|uniref:hypothetical protein n=1 Tax=Halococcus agarilyticus TaxID=1232219 RepID=UPI0012AB78BB|nr:hypothetical protein [Halococcus agarilyticus]
MVLPLQTGTGSTGVLLVLFSSLLVSVILSFVIGLKGMRSYRESHDWGIVLLVVGILLLSGIPTSINVVLTTFTTIPDWIVETTVTLIRLFGLVTILVSIYDQ